MLLTEFKKQCENTALTYRQELGLYGYDPLPANLLAKHLNVPLRQPQDLQDLDEDTVTKLLDANNWWAATIPGKHPFIVYHPFQPKTRYESSVMHELSHIILKHEPEQLLVLVENFMGRFYPRQDEEEARYLGACLQIPKLGIDWSKQMGFAITETAKHFGASERMIRYRLNMTGRQL